MKVLPHVDLRTGKIYGCKKNSEMWFHEKGHIEFDKLPSTSTLKLVQGYAFSVWMFSTTLAILNKYMLWISIPLMIFYIGIEVYEERWANNYVKRNYEVFK